MHECQVSFVVLCECRVNNAGVSQQEKTDLEHTDAAVLKDVIDTNLTGSIFGARAALKVPGWPSPRMH